MPMFAIILSFVKSACEFYIYHGQVNCDFGPNGNRNCRIAFNSGSYHSSYGTFVCCIRKKKILAVKPQLRYSSLPIDRAVSMYDALS